MIKIIRHLLFVVGMVLVPTAYSQNFPVDSLLIQGDTIITSSGTVGYSYIRTIERDSLNPLQLIITLTFSNGESFRAVTYRQENLYGTIEWIENEAEMYKKETIVESLTTRIHPMKTVTWRCNYIIKSMPEGKDRCVDIDKAALMIMDEELKVEKREFQKEKIVLTL